MGRIYHRWRRIFFNVKKHVSVFELRVIPFNYRDFYMCNLNSEIPHVISTDTLLSNQLCETNTTSQKRIILNLIFSIGIQMNFYSSSYSMILGYLFLIYFLGSSVTTTKWRLFSYFLHSTFYRFVCIFRGFIVGLQMGI